MESVGAGGAGANKVPADLDSLANAARAKAPAVFVIHGADTITPAGYQWQVAEAYAGPKRVIEMPGAGHDSPLTREAALKRLGMTRNELYHLFFKKGNSGRSE